VKVIKYFLMGIGVYFILYTAALFYTMHTARVNAQEVCDLAIPGMTIEDFTNAHAEKGLDGQPHLSKTSNGEEYYFFLFYHIGFSGEVCDIYIKDGVITRKETSMERDGRYANQ